MPGLPVLGRAFLVLFAVSTLFPVLAWFAPRGLPSVIGILDLGLASIVVVAAFTLESRAKPLVIESDRARAWLVIRAGATGLLAVLGIFFLAPGYAWDLLVIGLTWRAWLFVWVLPSLIASLRRSR